MSHNTIQLICIGIVILAWTYIVPMLYKRFGINYDGNNYSREQKKQNFKSHLEGIAIFIYITIILMLTEYVMRYYDLL
ncbi:hypothetical protein J9332_08660 [Aquimarina celericrescens]|nr:hypothetical protein [Aquimarina celericrescens]